MLSKWVVVIAGVFVIVVWGVSTHIEKDNHQTTAQRRRLSSVEQFCHFQDEEAIPEFLPKSPLSQEEVRSKLCTEERRKNPVPVFRMPNRYLIGEGSHFIRDGIRKSECLNETDDLLTPIWIVDRIRLKDCGELTQAIHERFRKCEETACSNWTVIQIDYSDSRDFSHCSEDLLDNRTGVQQIWYRRSMVQNRTGLSGDQPSGRAVDYSPRTVWHIPYGVRSDIVLSTHRIMSDNFSVPLPNSTIFPLCPVYRSRPGGVRFVWFTKHRLCRTECQDATTRFSVSAAVRQLASNELMSGKFGNHTVHVGPVGLRSELGRRFATEDYVLELMNYKIVVTAQRDFHEDHYRLMEAFAGGALVLADPMVMPPKYLVDGQHYVVYTSTADLKAKILYYLNCPKERLRIAYNGWSLVMTHYRSWHMMDRIIFSRDNSVDV